MFTGIITAVTPVVESKLLADNLRLRLKMPKSWDDLELGESISVSGVCLTVSKIEGREYEVELVPETLQKTTFGQRVPQKVNIERALPAASRFGGHFVEGHIDSTGKVLEVDKSDGYRISIAFEPKYQKLVIDKGAIVIDGASLTVIDPSTGKLSVTLVPYTIEHTTLGNLTKGDQVNLEFDMIGKYVVNVMEHSGNAAA
ncbi:MAG TPA: riboflavin synthase [Patescibacteria group bacterium]|nr:riboflavin synthase [Patescibacteria group bacterium]